MTAKEKLLAWAYEKFPNWAFRTSDVARYGVNSFSNRAIRNARALAESKDGKPPYFERVENKRQYGIFDSKEEAYKLTPAGKKKAEELLKKRDFPLFR